MAKFNVIKDYDWTSIPRGAELRNKAPKVVVRSYKLKGNQMINRLNSYIKLGASTDPFQYYENLYGDATEQEDDFYFPYFGSVARNASNSFQDTFKNGFGGAAAGTALDETAKSLAGIYTDLKTFTGGEGASIKDVVNAAVGTEGNAMDKMAAVVSQLGKAGNPGSYAESPQFYNYDSSKEGSLSINFILSNTVNSDFMKNYELVKKLIEINKPKRIDNVSVEPPRIYKVKLYGYRFMPWAFCDNLNVQMMGTKRMINDVIIPEAFNITMGLQPLTGEVSNFMERVK